MMSSLKIIFRICFILALSFGVLKNGYYLFQNFKEKEWKSIILNFIFCIILIVGIIIYSRL